MYSITARLAASAALAAICAAGAAAACPTPCNAIVINDQIQLGDVFSNLVITAATPHSLTGVSAASGSSVAAGAVETGLIFDSRQELAANVAAGAVIEADSVAGQPSPRPVAARTPPLHARPARREPRFLEPPA
jgi:hypothetical protein